MAYYYDQRPAGGIYHIKRIRGKLEEEEKRERKRKLEEKIKEERKQNAEEKRKRKQEDDDKIELIIYYKNYNI